MKTWVSVVLAIVCLVGCSPKVGHVQGGRPMKTLTIRWQRLVDEKGATCDRCGSTEQELKRAFQSLKESLSPLGIEVALEKRAIDPATCAKDISQSNRIWLGDRPLEDWLGGEVGKSLCGFCCEELGDGAECRTVTVGGRTYETIPSQLIVKAGLLASSQLLEAPAGESCCPTPRPAESTGSTCCPKPTKNEGK